VDLCGSSKKDENYDADTPTVVFSSTKSLTAILMAILVDKGLLKYEEKVATYWPEFGQHGKENVKVEDVLRHVRRTTRMKSS